MIDLTIVAVTTKKDLPCLPFPQVHRLSYFLEHSGVGSLVTSLQQKKNPHILGGNS